ncbi:STKc_STK36 domain-containing protein fused [Calliopsis andreniformis]|uniref:STKc_STK36 domain-containing protein fused n=1 Tax=Calliopsis andreniformis TaxID=337506 RepID=UPI003FCC9B84
MEKYEVLKKVGEGSYGQVYKAKKRCDGEIVAYKVIQKRGRSLAELKSLRQEYEILCRLHHPNIIQMFDSFETENEIVVVTEYAGMELYKILAKAGRLSEEAAQAIASDLVSALYYLHCHNVLHRDLKPQNVLLKSNGVAKLGDFGFARTIRAGATVLLSVKGTPLYMAPEIFDEEVYDHKADLWSLGCIIYELVVGSPPFKTDSILRLVRLLRSEEIKWPDFVSQTCKSFLQGLLQKDCKKRLTWPALLNHDFVKDRVTKIGKARKGKTKKEKHDQLQDSTGCHRDKPLNKQLINDRSNLKQRTISWKRESKVIHCKKKQINMKGNDSGNNSVPYNYELPGSGNAIENEEWIAFLQRTMKEIMNGEVDMLLTPHCISIFMSPLKGLSINHFVLKHIAYVLSLSFVVPATTDLLDEIHRLYFDLKVITHLVNAVNILMTMPPSKLLEMDRKPNNVDQANTIIRLPSTLTPDELDTLEYTMLILCRLVHWNHSSAIEFCHAIYVTNGVAVLQQLLTLENMKARIVADLVAILNYILTVYTAFTARFVEKVISFSYLSGYPIEQFRRLLTHEKGVIRARTCRLIGVLATHSSKSLEQVGFESLTNLIEDLTSDDDQTVKFAADDTINILKQLIYHNHQNSAIERTFLE